MSTKKKLVISLTSLAIVLVVAVAAVGITLAALNGSVNSSFTITYTKTLTPLFLQVIKLEIQVTTLSLNKIQVILRVH